jgi:hypothetical protein
MIWQFTLVDSSNAEFAINEPVGWDEITWTARRNIMHHGIFFNINTGNLKYIDLAFDMLLAEYELNGADGTMQLKIEYQCTPQETFEEFFFGKFDFNTFKRTCAKECFIECQVIAVNCVDNFLSAIDTDISLDTTKDLQGNTISHILEQTMLLQGQDIVLNNKANNNEGLDSNNVNCLIIGVEDIGNNLILPIRFPNTPINDNGTFNANGSNPAMIQKGLNAERPWTVVGGVATITESDWNDYMQFTSIWKPENTNLNCVGNWDTILNLNATITVEPVETAFVFSCFLVYKIYNSTTNSFSTTSFITIISPITIAAGGILTAYPAINDIQTFNLADDETLCLFWQFQFNLNALIECKNITINVNYAGENNFSMTQNSSCPSTYNKSYNVNDVFEFIPTVISNGCFTVNANNSCLDYYSICNGLQIRNVVSPRPEVFLNFSDYFKNISKIFNLGWGFDANETELIIDDVRNFYAESIITDVGSVNQMEFQNATELNYSLINLGYSTWEAEEYSGLDEMNTARQYRRNVNGFNKPIDILSNYIAAGYTIEITRRKNQALTGTSDWRFDNNIFIINNSDTGANVTAFRGVEADPENISSPGTRLNYIITPIRNLMRWFKSLAMSPDYTSEILTFNSSNGNYIAGGQMTSYCPIEAGQIFENETITSADFLSQNDARPIWKPMYMTFECPLTMAQKILIQANPYSVIKANCNGTDYYGSIISCDYSPNQGTAKFKLLEKIIYG